GRRARGDENEPLSEAEAVHGVRLPQQGEQSADRGGLVGPPSGDVHDVAEFRQVLVEDALGFGGRFRSGKKTDHALRTGRGVNTIRSPGTLISAPTGRARRRGRRGASGRTGSRWTGCRTLRTGGAASPRPPPGRPGWSRGSPSRSARRPGPGVSPRSPGRDGK